MIIDFASAILDLYPNAQSVQGNSLDECVVSDAEGNVISIDKHAVEARIPELKQQYEAKIASQLSLKESAVAKLAALGLTNEEIAAITGAQP